MLHRRKLILQRETDDSTESRLDRLDTRAWRYDVLLRQAIACPNLIPIRAANQMASGSSPQWGPLHLVAK